MTTHVLAHTDRLLCFVFVPRGRGAAMCALVSAAVVVLVSAELPSQVQQAQVAVLMLVLVFTTARSWLFTAKATSRCPWSRQHCDGACHCSLPNALSHGPLRWYAGSPHTHTHTHTSTCAKLV